MYKFCCAGLKRCGRSCRLRWLNYLRPNIKHGNISLDEEDLIIRMHRLLGNWQVENDRTFISSPEFFGSQGLCLKYFKLLMGIVIFVKMVDFMNIFEFYNQERSIFLFICTVFKICNPHKFIAIILMQMFIYVYM